MTKQTNGKLGSAFWTNFVRLDRVADGKHSESKLKEALGATGLQLELQPMGGDAISLIELQKNSKQARELVRAKGFRVPCARRTAALRARGAGNLASATACSCNSTW